MELYIARQMEAGVVRTSNTVKQKLGQAFAEVLGLQPGPRGPDGGVDGAAEWPDGRIVHFQSKLSAAPLGLDQARLYYADVLRHEAAVSIMLSGVGYKASFHGLLCDAPHLDDVRLHLLRLSDVFARTDAFRAAVADVPEFDEARQIDFKRFQ